MEQQKVDLDALEAKLAKATPGPWRRGTRHEYVVVHLDHGYIVCDEDPEDDNAERVEADTDTIIAAHNALPALIAELRELRAENAAIKARAWRSIETAPKNGTGFLAWNESLRIVEASWWSDNMAGITHWQPFPDGPTHALPLPPAPEAQ